MGCHHTAREVVAIQEVLSMIEVRDDVDVIGTLEMLARWTCSIISGV